MTLNTEVLEVRFKGCPFGVSARRIHEHMTLEQINPFARPLASVRTPRDAAELIDLVRFDAGEWYSLTGLTLAALDEKGLDPSVLKGSLRAARNAPARFLGGGGGGPFGPFGVPLLRSRLAGVLAGQAQVKAPAVQWLGTLENLTRKGLRNEELQRSGLIGFLQARAADKALLAGARLERAADFSALRLAVIANIGEARTQLHFEAVPERERPKIKGEKRPQAGQRRRLHLFERALGYRIEEVEHPALWGTDRHWQAVTFEGSVLRHRVTRRAIFASPAEAVARAQEHAREVLPKLLASERWVDWSWTGGEHYREWLITLPCFPGTYVSKHFGVRNVLAHVRCDYREGAEGARVLMLHEVQSDWMQNLRRIIQRHGKGLFLDGLTPFMQEWPALALKLMLLHAAHSGADALAWTSGAQQAQRYRGLGGAGLRELYDRTLPREAARALKPFGLVCETLEVFVPDNFAIRRTEAGYEVRTGEGALLGVAASFGEARALMPDGAHERLYAVHGVRLDRAAREAMLEKGFMAWG